MPAAGRADLISVFMGGEYMQSLQGGTERRKSDALFFKIVICFLFSVACLFLDASAVVLGGPYYLPVPYFYTLMFVICFYKSQTSANGSEGAVNFYTVVNVGLFLGISGYILFDCTRGGNSCPAQSRDVIFDLVVYRTLMIAFLGHIAAVSVLKLAVFITDRWTRPHSF